MYLIPPPRSGRGVGGEAFIIYYTSDIAQPLRN